MLQQIYNTINVIVAASASHSISTTRSPGRRRDVEWRCVDEKKTQQQSEFIFIAWLSSGTDVADNATSSLPATTFPIIHQSISISTLASTDNNWDRSRMLVDALTAATTLRDNKWQVLKNNNNQLFMKMCVTYYILLRLLLFASSLQMGSETMGTSPVLLHTNLETITFESDRMNGLRGNSLVWYSIFRACFTKPSHQLRTFNAYFSFTPRRQSLWLWTL